MSLPGAKPSTPQIEIPYHGFKFVLLLIACGLLYILLASASYSLAFTPTHIPSIWAPGGVALAVMLHDRRRAFRQILPVFLLACVLSCLLTGYSLPASLGAALFNTLEIGLLAWFLFRRLPQGIDFGRLRDVLLFFGYTLTLLALSNLPAAGFQVLVSGGVFGQIWLSWWVSDTLGILLLVPLILSFTRLADVRLPRFAEGVILWFLLVGLSFVIFLIPHNTLAANFVRSYLFFPLFIWAVLRFDNRLVTVLLLFVAAIASLGTSLGLGQLSDPELDPWLRIFSVQVLLSTLAFGSLVLAAMLSERHLAEQRYRLQFKNLPQPSFTWQHRNGEFFLIDFNDAALSFTQGRVSAEVGRTVRALYPQHSEVQVDLQTCLAEQGVIRRQSHWDLLSSGEMRDLNITYEFVAPDLVVGHFEDVTGQRRTQEALQASDANLRALVNASDDFIALIERDGRLVIINESGGAGLGSAGSALLGSNIFELLPEQLRVSRQSLIEGVFTSSQPVFFTDQRAGRWFDNHIMPVLDADRQVRRAAIFARDITTEKQALAELQASEMRYQSLFETSQDGILITAPTGEIIAANPAAVQVLGWSEAELRAGGRDLITDPDDPALPAAIAERARTGAFRGVLRHKRRDGSIFPAEVSTVIYKTLDGQVRASLFLRDFSERVRAEQALRGSEANLRSLMNAADETIFLIELDGTIVAANELAANRLGSSVAQMVGRNIYDFLPLSVGDARRSHVRQVLETTRAVTFEDQRADRWFDNHLYPVLDESGRVVRLGVFARDITFQKNAEQVLRASEERFRLVFESSLDAIILSEPITGTLLAANPAAQRMFDRSAAELLGCNRETLFDTSDPAFRAGMVERASTGRFNGELTCRRRDGSTFPVEVSTSIYQSSDGTSRASVILRDITTRKQAESAVRRLAAIVESTDDAIIGKNLDGIIETWNRGAEHMYGYTPVEAIGQPISLLVPPDLEDDTPAILAQVRAGQHIRNFETRRRARDGRLLDVALTVSPILDAGGEVVAASIIARDIGERVRAGEALRSSERRYRTLFENASLAIFQVTPAGRPLAVNPAFLQLFGYDSWDDFSALVSNSAQLFADPARREEILRQQTADPRANRFETTYRRKDGSTFVGQLSVQLVRDEAKSEPYLEGFIENITERKQFENALRASEELYHAMFHSTSAVKLLIDPASGQIVRANLPASDYYGYSLEQLERMNINEINTLPTEKIQQEMQNAKNETRTFFNFQHRLASGEVRDVEVYSGPLHVEGRSLLHSIIHDVTARKQAERIAAARNRLLEFAVNHTLSELLTATLDETEALTGSQIGFYHFIEADQQTLSLQSWSTRTLRDFCTAEGAGTHYPIDQAGVWADAARTRQPIIHNDYNALSADLRRGLPPGHAEVRRELVVPVLRGPRVVCILGVGNKDIDYTARDVEIVAQMADLAWDIAERKRGEEALAHSQTLLNDTQAIAQVGGWDYDIATRQVSWTEEIYQIYALDHTTNPSDIPDALAAYDPQDRPLVDAAFNLAVTTGQPYDLEVRFINALGRRLWVRTSAKPVYHAGGLLRLTGTIMDITERKEAELALRAARDGLEQRVQERTADLQSANLALEKALKAKDEFLAAISHELRTPLTGVLGLSQVLQMQTYGPLTDKQVFALKNIELSGQRLLELINDILDFSLAQSGALSLYKSRVSLEELCQDCLKAASVEAAKKHQAVSFQSAPPSLFMQADARQVARILRHLLTNASKFTPDGGSLGIQVQGDEDAHLVHITVWDTGIGIQEADLPRLFKPFVQLDARLQRQYGGTGLGLALVKLLAELHGGSIHVTSEFGKGSRFTVSLPWQE